MSRSKPLRAMVELWSLRRTRPTLALLVCAAALGFSARAVALAPGDFDSSFGTGGTVLKQLGAPNALALQPDGRIVVAGDATDGGGHIQLLVTRLNPGGDVDGSFGSGGTFVNQFGAGGSPSSEAKALALQPDGKIVVAGEASPSQLLVARLNPGGDVDGSFGLAGKVVYQLGMGTNPVSAASALVLQPDGKIVVAGDATDANGNVELLVARLNPRGDLDTTFGTSGRFAVEFGTPPSPFSFANALALQPDGKLVVAGVASDGGGHAQVLVARLNPDGSLDGSFGSGGKLITQFGAGTPQTSAASALALQPDGRILVAGRATDPSGQFQLLVARLNADGGLDTTFGSHGTVASQLGAGTSPFSAADALALGADGGIVTAGLGSDGRGHDQLLVARLNPDGGLDTTFGSHGTVARQFGAGTNPRSEADALTLQPDGKIVLAGVATGASGDDQFLVARLLGNPPPATSPPQSNPVPVTRPRLTHVSQSQRRWRAGRALPRIARVRRPPLGTIFRFTLNERASVRFGFARWLPGRRVGRRCLAQTRGNRHRRSCTRTLSAGAFGFSAGAGNHRLRFQGRLSRHNRLKPGRYTLTITATNAAGRRATARLKFTIVKG